MPPEQISQLKSWLVDEKITYREAIIRLKDRFNVQAKPGDLSKFWQRICAPEPITPDTVLLDVRLKRHGDDWRLTVLRRSPGLNVTLSGQNVHFCTSKKVSKS